MYLEQEGSEVVIHTIESRFQAPETIPTHPFVSTMYPVDIAEALETTGDYYNFRDEEIDNMFAITISILEQQKKEYEQQAIWGVKKDGSTPYILFNRYSEGDHKLLFLTFTHNDIWFGEIDYPEKLALEKQSEMITEIIEAPSHNSHLFKEIQPWEYMALLTSPSNSTPEKQQQFDQLRDKVMFEMAFPGNNFTEKEIQRIKLQLYEKIEAHEDQTRDIRNFYVRTGLDLRKVIESKENAQYGYFHKHEEVGERFPIIDMCAISTLNENPERETTTYLVMKTDGEELTGMTIRTKKPMTAYAAQQILRFLTGKRTRPSSLTFEKLKQFKEEATKATPGQINSLINHAAKEGGINGYSFTFPGLSLIEEE